MGCATGGATWFIYYRSPEVISIAHAGRRRGGPARRLACLEFRSKKAVNALDPGPTELGVFYSDMWRIRKDQSGIYFESPDVQRGVLIDERTLDYQVACVGIVSALIKRECFAQVGVFDESLIRYSDLDLFIRSSDRYDFLHCKEPFGEVLRERWPFGESPGAGACETIPDGKNTATGWSGRII